MLIIAFSGGKDSTALALELHRRGELFALLHTPTGNELPGVSDFVERIAYQCEAELIIPTGPSLAELIDRYNALPNFRMRWCTREIKIEPCIQWFKEHREAVLAVGLRADEELRKGLYGDLVRVRYPLREWGWTLSDVQARTSDVGVPRRTDCAICPFQTIGEWHRLWFDYPDEWTKGEQWETDTEHTFRSPGRDSWPLAMVELRREFERGKAPRKDARQGELFESDQCRVCRL